MPLSQNEYLWSGARPAAHRWLVHRPGALPSSPAAAKNTGAPLCAGLEPAVYQAPRDCSKSGWVLLVFQAAIGVVMPFTACQHTRGALPEEGSASMRADATPRCSAAYAQVFLPTQ
eukprot:COSAG01_NODE_241_length_20597_cov_8.200751_14_plen_116_part_00